MAPALRTTLVLAALLLVALPGQAAAQKGCPQGQAPGNSEIDQYAESFPGSCGKQRFDPNRAGDAATGSSGAAAGAAAAGALSRATAPTDAPPGSGGQGAGADQGVEDPSALGGVTDAATGGSDGGMGLWLPLILIGAVAVAVGVGLLRWRSRAG